MLPVYVAIPQVQLLDKVFMPSSSDASLWRCRSCSSSSRSSTSLSVRRDSSPWSHFSETIEILLLQYIDKAVDVGCECPACSLVQSVRRQSLSYSCSFDAGHCRSHACCCATIGALAGRDSAESVGDPQLALSLGQVDDMPAGVSPFLGPCTQVHVQGCPPPLGRGRGGGDAGSLLPGVLPPN